MYQQERVFFFPVSSLFIENWPSLAFESLLKARLAAAGTHGAIPRQA